MSTFIVIAGSAVLFVVFVVLPACWLTSVRREKWAEAYWSELRAPATDDPGEWTGPLHTGGAAAEKRMRRYFRDQMQIVLRRTSEATRRQMAALDARRRPGWMLRHRLRPMRRAVFTAPVAEPPLEALPEGAGTPEQHDAPLPGTDDYGLTDATSFGFLAAPVLDLGLPPAPGGEGAASPIGDALAAEMGGEDDPLGWIDAWLASPLPGDGPAQAEAALYRDWVPDDSGIMRAIRGEAV